MKQKLIHCCAGALIGVLCVGCNDLKQDSELQGVDVPFTEYSFMDTEISGEEFFTRWINLDYRAASNSGEILVIDSEDELKKYVEGDYPPIDFSKKTLVLAYGEYSGGGFGYDGLQFQQVSDRNYVLTTYGAQSLALYVAQWQVAIVVDKLPSDSKIELKTVILN